jgi:hypothetical protein
MALDILPATQDISVIRGTDNTIEFRLTDGAGTPVNITNDSVKFTVRTSAGGTVAVATKTNAAGQHFDPTQGKTRFKLTKTDLTETGVTSGLTRWSYEVRRIAAGDEMVYIVGLLTLVPTSQPSV